MEGWSRKGATGNQKGYLHRDGKCQELLQVSEILSLVTKSSKAEEQDLQVRRGCRENRGVDRKT